MGAIGSKIWYDIWRHKVRTLLVIASIAVGVFAVGTTFGLGDQMLPAMDQSHEATFPSHMTLYLSQPVDRDIIRSLEKVAGVEAIEPVNIIAIRYKKSPTDTWHKGNLLMRDDFAHQKFDTLLLKGGIWPEGDSLGIERMHSPFYGLGIGDNVIFEIDNREHSFPISGIIRHPFVPPPFMYDLAWFFSDAAMMERFGIPQGKFLELLVRVTPYSADYAKEVATSIKEQLAKQNISVQAAIYQDPHKHWGRPFVEGMGIVTEVLAVMSLLLSAVLVLNTLTSIITQQTNQIGILKAIGSSRQTVIRIYLSSVLAYGALALFIALPLGISAAYGLTRWYLSIFNIDYETFHFSTGAVIFQLIAAIAVPLVAALPPVFKGASITVREAISSYGLGADFQITRFDQALEKWSARFLSTHYVTAFVNTFRRKGRLIMTEVVLVIAGVMYLMVMSLSSSIDATLDAEFNRRTHDVVVQFESPQRIERVTALAESLPGVEKAVMWSVEPVTILLKGQKVKDAGAGSQIQGVPLDDPTYIPYIVEGRWLENGDERALVISQDTAKKEKIRVWETITLDIADAGQSEWTVVGIYKNFLMFGGGFNVDAMYAPREAVLHTTKKVGRTQILLVRTQDHSPQQTRTIANNLESFYKDKNMAVAQTETIAETRRTADTSFQMTVYMLLSLAFVMALVGAIGLAGSLSISVIERTKEIGVLRAIGARSRTILRMFLLEGVVQGLLSWVIAIPLSFLLAPLLANAMGKALFNASLEFGYHFISVFIWLLVVLVFSSVASILPARSATRVNVRESLSYE
ncbi:MAG: FtsX-like permease family protein [Chloroflexota bacterium]